MKERPATRIRQGMRGALAAAATAAWAAGVGFPSSAAADVALDSAGKVKLFGDVRYRGERTQDGTAGGNDTDRSRLRARLGVGFQANDQWAGRIRLATHSNDLHSAHQTFGLKDPADNADFGLDQAYLTYSGVENLSLMAGKQPLNYWQQDEVFWDEDINNEALAATYKIGPVTLNGAYTILVDNTTDTDDATLLVYQIVYGGEAGGMKYTLALGGASLDDSKGVSAYTDGDDELHFAGQLKSGPWLAGVDYFENGKATTEETAYVVQGRYQVNDALGLRAYYYSVEANSLIAGGDLTQDNFPRGTNFEGTRLQLDYKVADNTAIDLRWYDEQESSGAAYDKTRYQVNVNVKF